MSYSRRSRYSVSPAPKRYRSISRPVSRSRSRSRDPSDAENPGNNLYVTGLSTRVTKRELEKHFSSEGKVEDIHLVVDPRTRESRGFGFVTMSTLKEADRCIKYLDGSVLEGRVITVEKSRRKRGRTPTPGRYLGLRASSVRRRSPSYSPNSRRGSPRYLSESDGSRSTSSSPYYRRSHSPYRRGSYSPHDRRRSYSPHDRRRSYGRSYSPYDRRRSYSPHDRRRSYGRSYSPYDRRRSYSPYDSCRSYSRSRSRSYSRSIGRTRGRDRSYSPYHYRRNSPEDRYYRRRYRSSRDYSPVGCCYRRGRGRYRTTSPSESPRSRRLSLRSYSRSVSLSSRSHSSSMSPRDYRRSYSQSVSPSRWSHKVRATTPVKSLKRSTSRVVKKQSPSYGSRSSRSHSRSPGVSSSSGSRPRSVSPCHSP